MASDALVPTDNLRHNILAPTTADPQHMFRLLAGQYLRTQVAGQAEGTIEAKQLDLACFLRFYLEQHGHRSNRYICRCVKPDTQSLADAIDELE